jgi:hypothetical protein
MRLFSSRIAKGATVSPIAEKPAGPFLTAIAPAMLDSGAIAKPPSAKGGQITTFPPEDRNSLETTFPVYPDAREYPAHPGSAPSPTPPGPYSQTSSGKETQV